MRKIDESERPMPEIDLAKVCFIIEKSREYLGEDAGVEPDNSNPADDDEHIMLTDAAGRSLRRELIEFIKDLDVDEAAALVALAWIGRGDLRARGVENRGRGGEGASGGADLEIPLGNGAAAGLPRGRALRLRPFLRGLGVGGRERLEPNSTSFPLSGFNPTTVSCTREPTRG